ncbi:MAG: 2-amino-4-hydroxy-6-hydroxymethyldihydropteridine diphosphokinase [Clostridiales bacterium]|nr:2-amino-4-hydroxy-6-hydroxymethyldihydropteridine diphosphokinase [Clostridiales bacterium]
MNQISLKGLKIFGYTGCLPSEKENGQNFLIDIDMFLKSVPGALTDNLNDTVNYAQVYETARGIVSSSGFDLIEHLAHEIGRSVLDSQPMVDEIRVTVKKPDAPIDGEFDYMMTVITLVRRTALIGFGSNMGDKEQIIKEALRKIDGHPLIWIKQLSSLYKTEPVGYEDQDDFLNGVVSVETYLDPLDLLHFLQSIESDLHRVRTIKNGPRTIDLDILLIDGFKSDTAELTVPHPRMNERAFVLVPMKEIGLYDGPVPEGKAVSCYGKISL